MPTARTLVVALLATLAVLVAPTAAGAAGQQIAIGYGDTVDVDVPAPGAGVIAPGDEDEFSFAATAGDVAILDVRSGSAGSLRWRIADPSGAVLFDGLYLDRTVAIGSTGTYTATVRGATPSTEVEYSFDLLLTPPPEAFSVAIGDTVGPGDPGPGAGEVEVPGARDEYRFDGAADQEVVFDVLAGRNVDLAWALTAPDGTTVFDSFIGDRAVTLPQTGRYLLTMRGLTIDRTGTYSFVLQGSPAAQAYAIALGDVVSAGVPGPGAGSIEAPGAVDRYTFAASAGDDVALTTLAGDTIDVRWSLHAPDGTEVFDQLWLDQQHVLPATGTYALEVRGLHVTSTGTYAFALDLAPPPVNVAPTIAPVSDQEGTEGDPVAVAVAASDPDGDVLTHSASGLPAGLGIDPATGVVSGTLAPGSAGTHTVEAAVTDPGGLTASTTFTWLVHEPLPPAGPLAADVQITTVPGCLCGGAGLVLVTIHGDADLRADDVDLPSIELAGMPVARLLGTPLAVRTDVDGDGDRDVLALIDPWPLTLPAGTGPARVTAALHDGTPLEGTDDVCVRRSSWWPW